MLADLLDCLARVRGVGGVVLVSDEHDLPRAPAGLRVERFPGGDAGLNAELAAALAALAARGVRRALVLHGDLPLADARDLQTLVDLAHDDAAPHVALVPDRHRRGTNAMLLAPPDAITPRFGVGSLARHERAARRRGIGTRVVPLSSLALDVDTPEDLAAVLAAVDDSQASGGTPARRALALIRASRTSAHAVGTARGTAAG